MSWFGAAVSAGASLLSNPMSYYYDRKMAKYNQGLELSTARQMPSAQVEGLKNAGLNPVLAAFNNSLPSSGQSFTGTGGSDLASSARQIGEIMQRKERELADATIKKTEAETSKARKESEMIDSQIPAVKSQSSKQVQEVLNWFESMRDLSPAQQQMVATLKEQPMIGPLTSMLYRDYMPGLSDQKFNQAAPTAKQLEAENEKRKKHAAEVKQALQEEKETRKQAEKARKDNDTKARQRYYYPSFSKNRGVY